MPRDYVHFTLISASETEEHARALRGFLGTRPHKLKVRSVSIDVFVPAEGALAKELRRFIMKQLRVPPFAAEGRIERLWNDTELNDVAWFQVEFSMRLDGYAGDEFENTFDRSNACPECGLGSVLEEPVITDWKPNAKRALHQLLTGEWVVNDSTREAFETEGVRGAAFLRLVSAAHGHELDGVRLLQPCAVAPPVHPSAPLQQDRCCRACALDAWGASPKHHPRFANADDALPSDVDFLWTHEAFGIRGGKRWVLVSRRVYKILKHAKARGLEFRPVELLDPA